MTINAEYCDIVSESIGFIANLESKEAIDYVFYVTAHEIAHQWWAHQLIGADTQGSTMLSETMSQYSALMVMEKRYGKEKMRRFLKYELDSYLRGRGGELVAETPLVLVEDQPYIHYRKGSVVMYALRDLIGEDVLNGAIRTYLKKNAYQQPPYTVSTDLLAEIKKVTPPQYQQAVTDMFEKITIYENRATAVTSTKRADGKYAVKMTIAAKKFYADDRGRETAAPLHEWIDIGVLAPKDSKTKEEKTLYLERKLIDKPEMTFEVVVNQQPGKAGVDPYNKLIDRNPEDNVKAPE
jgi:aminopeptidase N